jgi:tryptophan-rich sensory protein
MNFKIATVNKIHWKAIFMLVGSILLCESVGIISKLAVSQESLIWYKYLFKPVFTPPAWLFGSVWIILYLLMGISLYLILKSNNDKNLISKKFALTAFGVQLFLNGMWAPVFFGLRSTLGGLAVVLLLLAVIFLTFYKFYKISIPASYLLIPYLLWVSYALGLNLTFWIYNH